MNKSIEARKAERKQYEDEMTAHIAENPPTYWSPEKEAAERAKHEAEGEKEDAILASAFGEKEFDSFSNGCNAGEAAGKAYNAFLNSIGFNELETDMYKKPVEAWGPKLHIRERWKRIGTVKGRFMNSTFYVLKDSDKVIVLETISGGTDRFRELYVQK